MMRFRLSTLLLLNTSAALAVTIAACSGTDQPGNTGGGTSVGATGGTAPGTGGTTGGTGATSGTGTGGTGSPAGGTTGVTGGAGGTGGTGGSLPGTGGFGGAVTGGSAGMGLGASGGMTGGGAGLGAGGGAGTGVGTGGTGAGSCTVTPTATKSTAIASVFNVAFTTDLASPTEAHIDFGPDTNYGFTAPVDMADPATPLLGMKPGKDYHYRVTVTNGTATCMSADQTITTGPLSNGLPKATITTPNPTALAGGFLVGEWYAGKQLAFILDKDGDIVWWFDPKIGDLTRARMSYDGKSMWIAHGNVPCMQSHMVHVSMDGMTVEDKTASFPQMNHDFTILPDGTMYFIAYSSCSANTCDDIMQYTPSDGMTKKIMNIGMPFSDTSRGCHANAIEYSKEDDTLVVSELDHNGYVKIKRTGEVVWVLGGGGDNKFTGDGATWTKEHNLEMLGANHLLMFNNGSGSGGSKAIELQLDTTAWTATKLWEYQDSSLNNAIMGDVQRLPNGNTLVTYSTLGVIHEVDANKMLLQTISWGAGGAIGYVVKRPTLYGPPPK